MPEFFIELFSEEIPARMQAKAAEELAKICGAVLADLQISAVRTFFGPRRIALAAEVAAGKPGGVIEARGPRDNAPEAAISGFLGKYKASRDELVSEGGFFLLRRQEPAVAAADFILAALPVALAKFSWPKSMRWGQSGDFTWVRPLRRIILLLDGQVIPMKLGPVTAGNETEGHRFMAPGAFAVTSATDWETKLRDRKVIAGQVERRMLVADGLSRAAMEIGLTVVEDTGLVDEVTGLIEWPVALVGKIDAQFMDLPPEVRELSMKVNQRYFALRDGERKPAPYFAFAANIEAIDGGKAIIAGNERVLRARLSDARHFWDLDLKTPLDKMVPKLGKIMFHAKIGTQLKRSEEIAKIAGAIATKLDENPNTSVIAGAAGYLCKADLVSGMVGEFPELQGIMGGYYAEKTLNYGEAIGPAIKTHYHPKGPSDDVPTGTVAISVALADKLYTLVRFFKIGEKPTGSGDPYALRRAALGVVRIVLENEIRLHLKDFVGEELFTFIIDRLRVKLRSEGRRFDVLDAVLAAGTDDDLVRVMQRVAAVSSFLVSEDGRNLLSGYRRAANILKIEEVKDRQILADAAAVDDTGDLGVNKDSGLRRNDKVPINLDEQNLADALIYLTPIVRTEIDQGRYGEAMRYLSDLRKFVDTFFDKVTVNDPVPEIRLNRLQLLARLRDTMHQIADFSKIEG